MEGKGEGRAARAGGGGGATGGRERGGGGGREPRGGEAREAAAACCLLPAGPGLLPLPLCRPLVSAALLARPLSLVCTAVAGCSRV